MNRKDHANQPDRQDVPDRDAESAGDHPEPEQKPERAESEPSDADTAAEAVERDLNQAIEALRSERDELEQRLLRTAADYQNYVRRAQQNVETAREQQLIDMAKGLVTVLDHFDRALEVDPEQTAAADLLTGVQMVRQELLGMLRRFGVDRIEVEPGEPFDPNRHEAMMREKRDDVDSNHVTQQLQPGYVIQSKVIRPAKVGVAE